MDQFGAENLKSLLNFLNLVGDFFFKFGRLRKFIADVNVHVSSLERGRRFREAAILTK
jgi:hypothetical protein